MLLNTKTNLPLKYEDKVQEELLEIMRDFKDNIFPITEVEQLVQQWRNRKDVRKSFQEKEEQLNQMRRQYEILQQKLKEDRPTPLERIKKWFSSSKKENVDKDKNEKLPPTQLSSEEKVGNYLAANHLRPISSLSLQSNTSTSSSGRLSTSSFASFGDSGTHSDHEERKHLMRQTSSASEHDYFEITEKSKSNYMIPPAPRPVIKYNQMKTFHPQNFKTINVSKNLSTNLNISLSSKVPNFINLNIFTGEVTISTSKTGYNSYFYRTLHIVSTIWATSKW